MLDGASVGVMRGAVEKLDKDVAGLEREQARLKEEMRVTSSCVRVEHGRLKEELSACRAKLYAREERAAHLRRRLEDSLHRGRVSGSKRVSIQGKSHLTKQKFGELKEHFDRLYSQIQSMC